ncbi:MAG: AAA family ATPase, partial [Xanthomonadales bacterium]|nr:AAA family ATPase [Xanthomonadales bacterium]
MPGRSVHLQRLRASHLRALSEIDLEPSPQINYLVGANGAGKTSVLEAIFLLSRGRTFRGGSAEVLTQHGHEGFHVYGEVDDGHGAQHRLGLGRLNHRWSIQVDGLPKTSRSALLAYCPVVCFDPGSHALISGAAEGRRRFADWGVFHVEHDFLGHWQRFQRALSQRNALLRQASPDRELGPWEIEMASAAQAIDALRGQYLTQFSACLAFEIERLVPALGAMQL